MLRYLRILFVKWFPINVNYSLFKLIQDFKLKEAGDERSHPIFAGVA